MKFITYILTHVHYTFNYKLLTVSLTRFSGSGVITSPLQATALDIAGTIKV